MSVGTPTPIWLSAFETHVKDTVEDELADVAIRILDYCAGYGTEIKQTPYTQLLFENFGENLLVITRKLLNNPVDALNILIDFCDYLQVDLLKHMEWKIRYNSTRSYKHGKAY